MKRIRIITIFMCAGFSIQAQNGYDAVLQQIEENNTTLAALRQQVEAQKLDYPEGLYPANPEVEFNYLWSNPSALGKRIDVSVRQTFDFPTAYAHRSKIADLQKASVDISYKAERLNVLLSAKQACIELAYQNALFREYAARLKNAERIAEVYKIKLDKGEVNILEHNKAQLNLTSARAEVAKIEAECAALLSELKLLNGGKELSIAFGEGFAVLNSQFSISTLPANFEEWYASAENKNPVLQYVRTQIEIEQRNIQLRRAMGLPKFSAGFMSEKIVGEHFQGVTVGMSIPLWENKDRVKQAQAQALAAEAMYEDSKIQFYNRLQTLYAKAVALQQNAQTVRQSLGDYNNEELLKKALDAGEISLLNYLFEIEYYYNAMNMALETERDSEMATAELSAVEM